MTLLLTFFIQQKILLRNDCAPETLAEPELQGGRRAAILTEGQKKKVDNFFALRHQVGGWAPVSPRSTEVDVVESRVLTALQRETP